MAGARSRGAGITDWLSRRIAEGSWWVHCIFVWTVLLQLQLVSFLMIPLFYKVTFQGLRKGTRRHSGSLLQTPNTCQAITVLRIVLRILMMILKILMVFKQILMVYRLLNKLQASPTATSCGECERNSEAWTWFCCCYPGDGTPGMFNQHCWSYYHVILSFATQEMGPQVSWSYYHFITSWAWPEMLSGLIQKMGS